MKSRLDSIKAANPILEIQLNLRDIAECNKNIPMIIPSGTYDKQTQNAVKEFQRIYNLPVTGKIDFETWNAIIKENSNVSHNIKTPSHVCCFPNSIKEYKTNDECSLIYILQIVLNNYSKKYINYPEVKLTGVFDIQTVEAIKEFQKCSMLPVTGVLDRKTWNTLNKIHEVCNLHE